MDELERKLFNCEEEEKKVERSKPNQIINNKIGLLYGINDESYRKWCKENKLNLTDKKNRSRYIKEMIENERK